MRPGLGAPGEQRRHLAAAVSGCVVAHLRRVGTGWLWAVSTLCAVAPPPGLYGVVGTGVLRDVSTLCVL
jgi:hypothetical protein